MKLLFLLFLQVSLAFAQNHTASLVIPNDNRTCYWPDGSAITKEQDDLYHYRPCFEGDSQCCALGEVCMTNGLCFGGIEGDVYRGACTDSTYRSANCPTFCVDSFPSSWANLVPCEMNSEGQWQWWCGHWDQTKWCTAGKNASLLSYPRGYTVKIQGVTNINTSSTSTSGTQLPTAHLPASESSCDALPAIKTSKHRMAMGIGLGVGLPLLIAVVALTTMLQRERKKTKGLKDALASQPAYNHEKAYYADGGYGPGELATQTVYELGETGRTPELDTKRATRNEQEFTRKTVPSI